jgi:hypothetical protein
VTKYEFTKSSILSATDSDVFLSTKPSTITELIEFCHYFLCLRLGKADWIEGQLAFIGEPIKPDQSLSMVGVDGQRKAAPLYLLYLIYSFWMDEQQRWTAGKAEPQMLEILTNLLKSQNQQTGAGSIGSSSENTQGTPDSLDETLPDAQPTSLSRRSKQPKKAA